MTVHELLSNEHRDLRRRVAELQTALTKNPQQLSELFPLFQEAVRRHIQREDSIYYRAVDEGKQLDDRELMHALRNDHAGVIFALESLAIKLRKNIPPDEWKKKFDLLVDVLLPHFDREEKELFPTVEKRLGPGPLKTILEAFQQTP